MTEEQREQWRKALAAKNAQQRRRGRHRGDRFNDAAGVRWVPQDVPELRVPRPKW